MEFDRVHSLGDEPDQKSILSRLRRSCSSSRESACFLTEESLVQDLIQNLLSDGGTLSFPRTAREFNYSSGRADLIASRSSTELYAFETKLKNWKEALQQARRTECFAHYSYVVLPEKAGKIAAQARFLFEKLGVGLIVSNGVELIVLIEAQRKAPLLPWLTDAAKNYLLRNQENVTFGNR
jgi:hypothetical protein